MIKKITTGFVIQNFTDNGDFINQEFTAGDEVTFENEKGKNIGYYQVYHSFNMEQK